MMIYWCFTLRQISEKKVHENAKILLNFFFKHFHFQLQLIKYSISTITKTYIINQETKAKTLIQMKKIFEVTRSKKKAIYRFLSHEKKFVI